MRKKAEELIKLAKKKGLELSETERKLLTSVAGGKYADYRYANMKNSLQIPLNYNNILHYKNACIGSLLRWYFWFHIAMGWVLTSLGVAGFTGLVRRLE